jgi:tripartite-type tricarboxylate transporter receptor subunit TctC
MNFRILLTAALALVIAGLVVPGDAFAQTYPTRPIRLLVGVPPGGSSDVVARTIGHPLGVRLGHNIVIDNRPGANANVAMEIAVNAPPNGYTLLHANDSYITINPHIYSKLPFNPMTGLVPVATLITNQLVLAVNPTAAPVNDVPGFIALAKRAKPHLFYASIGNGSQHHLGMEMLKQQAGIDLTHVPYRGGGPASIAIISGENAVMFGGGSVVPHIRSGKLRAIAVTGPKGWATMPELPSIADHVPSFHLTLWQGLFAPRGTPQAIIDRLRTEIAAVLALPEVRKTLIDSGAGEPYTASSDEFAALIQADYERYGKVIRSIGFKVD